MLSASIILYYLPILVCAGLVPALVKRLGHPKPVFVLSFIPLVATASSLLAILFTDRSLFEGPTSVWFIATILLYLVVNPRPETEKPNEESHS